MADAPEKERAPRLKRAEGISEEQWTLTRVSGSSEMAAAIISDDTVAATSDKEALADFLQVSQDAARDALKRYLKMQTSIGAKLVAAQDEYQRHRERTDRLYRAITGVAVERPGEPAAS